MNYCFAVEIVDLYGPFGSAVPSYREVISNLAPGQTIRFSQGELFRINEISPVNQGMRALQVESPDGKKWDLTLPVDRASISVLPSRENVIEEYSRFGSGKVIPVKRIRHEYLISPSKDSSNISSTLSSSTDELARKRLQQSLGEFLSKIGQRFAIDEFDQEFIRYNHKDHSWFIDPKGSELPLRSENQRLDFSKIAKKFPLPRSGVAQLKVDLDKNRKGHLEMIARQQDLWISNFKRHFDPPSSKIWDLLRISPRPFPDFLKVAVDQHMAKNKLTFESIPEGNLTFEGLTKIIQLNPWMDTLKINSLIEKALKIAGRPRELLDMFFGGILAPQQEANWSEKIVQRFFELGPSTNEVKQLLGVLEQVDQGHGHFLAGAILKNYHFSYTPLEEFLELSPAAKLLKTESAFKAIIINPELPDSLKTKVLLNLKEGNEAKELLRKLEHISNQLTREESKQFENLMNSLEMRNAVYKLPLEQVNLLKDDPLFNRIAPNCYRSSLLENIKKFFQK